MDTIIQKINAKPGQRIIAMSDIHGQPDYLMQLLRKVHYHCDDILVIVGDLIDRDVLAGTYFGCHPNVNTSSLRLKLEDLLGRILPGIHHKPILVELDGESKET